MKIQSLALSALLSAVSLMSLAQAATPYPTAATPAAVDKGLLREQAGAGKISATVVLKLRDEAGAEALMRALTTPGDPHFRQFLTREQFLAQFGPKDADVEKVSAALRSLGLDVTRSASMLLRVSGTPAQLDKAFQVNLHRFDVAATDRAPAYSFHAPVESAQMPTAIADLSQGVVGLSDRPSLRPHNHQAPAMLKRPQPAATAKNTGNDPGFLTVADFASHYDVDPLYAHGIDGEGRTLAIVTLASFTPSDAFAYWSAVGLKVDPKRLTVVNVDGGPGAPSDISGSGETTLDVEQSGGIAPAAKVVVYQAPNTDQAFLDAFAQVIDTDRAESISTSWGEWEWFDNLANGPVTDPYSGKTVSSLKAYHEVFVQAALQGQTMFAASGDSGAYDVYGVPDANNIPIVPPAYSNPLAVDNPASDTAMTAAGGTTLAGPQVYAIDSNGDTITIKVPHERVWGWDYLNPLCRALGLDPVSCGTYPAGGGGGVSVFFAKPYYQWFTDGVQRSQPGQSLIDFLVSPAETLFTLPANFAGRNTPDIAMNADPETGYVIYYTSDQSGFGIDTYFGGTSFVAPQLNGVTALLGQATHGRIGFINNQLYFLAHFPWSYSAKVGALRSIAYGDNWFYKGQKGYSPAAGLGSIDVANLAEALKFLH